MTQLEAQAGNFGLGDPKPTGEIPLQELGISVFTFIDEFRRTLRDLPEFGRSLAVNYLSSLDEDNRRTNDNGVFFERGEKFYTVKYSGSYVAGNESQKLVVDIRQSDNSKRIVLSGEVKKGVFSSAIANHIDNWGKGSSSLRTLNKPVAFERMASDLHELRNPTARSRKQRQTGSR